MRRLARAPEQIGRLSGRLVDPGFATRAPAAAQDKARADLAANEAEARRLEVLLDPAP
ncbi:hypothetical protein [Actinotalea ferrariae]|uniref:hypothetical protein n=1 Tax=Actinotalea ferrariae TaxID=1386098 RepID=UPI003CCBF180